MIATLERPNTPLQVMDTHKLAYHEDRLDAWRRGERFAPITIDMALSVACDANCSWCFAQLQANKVYKLTWPILSQFIDDAAEIGVKAISLLSDGESMLSKHWVPFVRRCYERGIDIAAGSNCHTYTSARQEESLHCLKYMRINFPAGTKARYCDIMGVSGRFYDQTVKNIKSMVAIKKRDNLSLDLVLQMVCLPQDVDEVIPFVHLAKELGLDACTVKHVSDDKEGHLGMDFSKVSGMIPTLREAQTLATPEFDVIIMWNKILARGERPYKRCYGPPFMLQISGTGLVAPCGEKFNRSFSKFHIGHLGEQRFIDIFNSDRYWEVMEYLRSDFFDAQKSCMSNCRQNQVNFALDREANHGERIQTATQPVRNRNFV